MKKMPIFFKNGFLFVLIALLTLTFSACKKTLDTGTNVSSSGLMAFNLVADKPSLGFAISGNNLTNIPLSYTSYTGAYLPIYPGNREVEAYDFSNDSSIAKATGMFEPNKFYSVFALGNNGTYNNLIVNDNLDKLDSTSSPDKAYVRYINAIPDSSKPTVTVTSGGSDVINNNASFASVSDFVGVTPGDVSFNVSNENTISANRTITLEKGKAYTVLLVGLPATTDTSMAVKIKFIVNGTLTQ